MATAGIEEIIATAPEAASWEGVFRYYAESVEHWTDEDWLGDCVHLRERLRRYDPVVKVATDKGWRVRPLRPDDWQRVEEWGLRAQYFNRGHFDAMRRHYRPELSGVAENAEGIGGLLVATQQARTATLEFITGHPGHPERWPLATTLLLRRLVAVDQPLVPFDQFTLTTNLHRGRAMHTLSRRLGLRRTREHHHYQVSLALS
ncbi:hypothetical protein H5P28_06250 [Ruficoccus amylovorans]|uniref:Uncharacterized protein n=1 Tax=Ruficoccus amylovorans TaxID=1804625 RepID=A0A842HCR6_9BACT|nr:hypothetical protein [Ruficoccus amylovorans]MBC2593858.1 hypothetical protein [Ruficoccus amylovorans]